MIHPPVRPGMPMRQVVTSRLINSLTQGTSPLQENSYPTDNTNNRIEVIGQLWQGAATDRIEPYEPVLLYEPYFELNTNAASFPERVPSQFLLKADMLANYNATNHGWLASWGIAQEAITTERAGRVLIEGVSWLKKLDTPPGSNLSTYRGIDIVNGVMTYDLFGRAEVIGNIGGTTKSHCLVNISNRLRSAIRGVTLSGGIPPGGSGPFYLQTPTAGGWSTSAIQFTGFNPNPSESISGNRNIVAVEVDGRWVVVFQAC